MKKRIGEIVDKVKTSKMGIIGNGVLYDMCKKYPSHTEPDVVGAKIWLIGRAYAAAIERRKKYRNDPNDDFYEKRVIPMMVKSNLDKEMNSIRKYKILSEDNILHILKVHKYLLNLFCNISGLEKRSLASKYLHFHFPNLFFIYDSRAKIALSEISRKSSKDFKGLINNKDIDKEYTLFFWKSYVELKSLEKEHGNITLRQFDSVLINIAIAGLRNK